MQADDAGRTSDSWTKQTNNQIISAAVMLLECLSREVCLFLAFWGCCGQTGRCRPLMCKQVRLDLLPERVTDIFFVLAVIT